MNPASIADASAGLAKTAKKRQNRTCQATIALLISALFSGKSRDGGGGSPAPDTRDILWQ
jgi:hypothetical protein